MNRDDVAQMMQDAAGTDWGTEAHFQRFASLVAAAEREAAISKIENETCHAEINNLRLAPLFGQQHGPLAVRVDSLAAVIDAIRARGEEPKRHPGYIMGEHWLQAAYTRICTGETEAEVMADYGWQRESR